MTDRPGVGRGTLVAGGLVLLAGVVWLLSAVGVDIQWEMVLAVALIGVGIALLALARSEGGTTPLIIAGAVITAVLAFTGGAGFGPATKVTEQADFAEPISRIMVDTPSGEVEVNAGGEIVHVERTLSYGDERPEVIEQVEDGVLTLSVRCEGGGFLIGGCGADYVITAPADVALEVDTGSGGIDINGMTAGGRFDTGSGGVDLEGVGGEVSADTGSGSVDGSALVVTSITADTGSGGVDLEFASAPDMVEVSTGSGSVEITVPEGTYAIAMDSSSGSETLEGVVNDPSAERTITIDTGSGGILVEAGG
jgi:hypothetical protein